MLCLKDFEKSAREKLPSPAWDFFSMGAEREITLKENEEAFKRYWFLPRMLRNVEHRDLSVTVLGEKIDFPVGLAPTAYQKMVHPEGEIAAARAATSAGTVYTMSTMSTTSLEDMSNALPSSLRWLQVYVMKDRSSTVRMLERAKQNGFKALVLTIDTPVTGLQLKLKRNTMSMPPHLKVPNIANIVDRLKTVEERKLTNIVPHICDTLTWDDIRWLKTLTNLPIVVKGVLTAEDAMLATKHGASGVWVSNHGGRQLDGTMASIDALQKVVGALAGTGCEVYMDGGIRWGSDVLRALALGARAVFIGRPLIWGLAHNGEEGVRKVLDILKDELLLSMKLTGCRDLSEVGPWILTKKHPSNL